MIIHWIVEGIFKDASGAARSFLASNRYRAMLPAEGLAARGHEVEVIPVEQWDGTAYGEGGPAPDIVVVGKLLPQPKDQGRFAQLSASLLASIGKAKQAGATVVADINDDHFLDPVHGNHWRSLAAAVDGVVAGSAAMAATASRYCATTPRVVGDPLGAPGGEPIVFRRVEDNWKTRLLRRVLPKDLLQHRLRLVWFGNPSNWPSMASWCERLAALATEQPMLIRVVTRFGAGVEAFADNFNARHGPSALMEFVPWEESEQWEVVRESHIVLIPSDLEDAAKSVKTANRLTDSLHCGRLVVASPVPAYREYENCAWLGEDLVAGVRWAIEHPDDALQTVLRGRHAVAERCSVAAIAKAWEDAFVALRANTPDAAASVASAPPLAQAPILDALPVKLNLGCGDKLLAGYVNVDIAPSRRGLRPDVLCDLHDLKCFAEGYADEILSVHVVEHFWRWEVPDILREWVRVLKPGGRMILECPNLLSACEALLADPEGASEGDARGQRTMWVLYGDPGWQDPLMTHRWGYTPHSLGKLMREVGLVNVRQEPAQYKLREPRDMRLVGGKPVNGERSDRQRG